VRSTSCAVRVSGRRRQLLGPYVDENAFTTVAAQPRRTARADHPGRARPIPPDPPDPTEDLCEPHTTVGGAALTYGSPRSPVLPTRPCERSARTARSAADDRDVRRDAIICARRRPPRPTWSLLRTADGRDRRQAHLRAPERTMTYDPTRSRRAPHEFMPGNPQGTPTTQQGLMPCRSRRPFAAPGGLPEDADHRVCAWPALIASKSVTTVASVDDLSIPAPESRPVPSSSSSRASRMCSVPT
jgi:hypothetical protein